MWEFIKQEARQFTKNFCTNRADDRNIAISQLSEYITHQEDEIHSLDPDQLKTLENSKIDLESMLAEKVNGVIFRSKACWNAEGEKNTKYFFSLEKNRSAAKTCSSILVQNRRVDDPKEILEEQRKFYADLYTSDSSVVCNLENCVTEQLPTGLAATSEEPFSEAELAVAVKSQKNNSCPGPDGLPAEFYKCFWKILNRPFTEAVHASFNENRLHQSSSRGVLNLIPKKGKDTRLLKNLRPITLLNTDYKIIEKAIANRMVPGLCMIIDDTQRGFLPGRQISANIRHILDVNYWPQQEFEQQHSER